MSVTVSAPSPIARVPARLIYLDLLLEALAKLRTSDRPTCGTEISSECIAPSSSSSLSTPISKNPPQLPFSPTMSAFKKSSSHVCFSTKSSSSESHEGPPRRRPWFKDICGGPSSATCAAILRESGGDSNELCRCPPAVLHFPCNKSLFSKQWKGLQMVGKSRKKTKWRPFSIGNDFVCGSEAAQWERRRGLRFQTHFRDVVSVVSKHFALGDKDCDSKKTTTAY